MRNVELKVRLHDRAKAVAICEKMHALNRGELHQVDTYFNVPDGRLKLRDFGDGTAELILYKRPDIRGAKTSSYDIAPADPSLARILSAAYGEVGRVEKRRTVYLWRNVRIHLDRVEGLGDFLEFEAVLGDEDTESFGRAQVAQLRERFEIDDKDLVSSSYLELVRKGN